MSLDSWKKEFYPISENRCGKSNKAMLLHTLLRYMGLRVENLRKHAVARSWDEVYDLNDPNKVFNIPGTCAFCVKFFGKPGCPSCLVYNKCQELYSNYMATGDPRKVIRYLKDKLRRLNKKGN